MSKQLFVVSLEAEVLVLADSPEDAEERAMRIPGLDVKEAMSAYASPMSYWPVDWEPESFPFGDDQNEKTAGELVAEGAAPDMGLSVEKNFFEKLKKCAEGSPPIGDGKD